MRRLCLKTLCAGAAAALLIAGCSDTTAPPLLQAPDGEALASTVTMERYIFSHVYPDGATVRQLPGCLDGLTRCHDVFIYRYGETGLSQYAGPAIYGWVDVTIPPTDEEDPNLRGALWTMVEQGGKDRYNVYYRFDLYSRDAYDATNLGDHELIGSFLAREQATCRKFPCATRGAVEIMAGSGTGVFEPGFSATMNTPRSELWKYDDGTLLQWVNLGGTLNWGGEGDSGDQDPDDPVKCTPAMERKGLC
jgi:hypothetical protein